ncbi:11106_t:CDS:2, partial [Ambispora gerdemannii]
MKLFQTQSTRNYTNVAKERSLCYTVGNHHLNYLFSFSSLFRSSNLYHFQQQHDTSFRRTWDKQEYEQCARDRARREQQLKEEEDRKTTQLVQSTSIASKIPGYYCKVCDCVVKDSVDYLDHINGKTGLFVPRIALDRTMKVERNTLDQVQNDWLVSSKKQKEKPQEYDFEASVEQMHNDGNEGEGLDPEMA